LVPHFEVQIAFVVENKNQKCAPKRLSRDAGLNLACKILENIMIPIFCVILFPNNIDSYNTQNNCNKPLLFHLVFGWTVTALNIVL